MANNRICSQRWRLHQGIQDRRPRAFIYSEQMQQQQVCTTSSYQQPTERSNAGAAIGGLAGALLGNGVGGGKPLWPAPIDDSNSNLALWQYR